MDTSNTQTTPLIRLPEMLHNRLQESMDLSIDF